MSNSAGIFGIRTAWDFLQKLEGDYADFLKQPDSARLALNCVMTAYHLHEWVWLDCLKPDAQRRLQIGLATKDRPEFRRWLGTNWSDFKTIEELTNGTKHCGGWDGPMEANRVSGFGRGPYGVGPYGISYLLVDLGEDCGGRRWQPVVELLESALLFWRTFFQRYALPTDGGSTDNLDGIRSSTL